MSWDASADELFPHVVTLVGPGALNSYGRAKVSATTPETRQALVEYKMRQTRDAKGEMTMSSIAVYLNGSLGVLTITPEWTLTLPDGTSRPILSVNRFADEDGDLLEVVYLQ